jgi:hypothetical protein
MSASFRVLFITKDSHNLGNGSDVFGSDICTCKPYLTYAIEECIRGAQHGMKTNSTDIFFPQPFFLRRSWRSRLFPERRQSAGRSYQVRIRILFLHSAKYNEKVPRLQPPQERR